MEDKWLNEWQKKLDGYEVAPPDGLWDGINKALEERRLSVASSRGRRTVWLRLAGIAAALAIVVPLGRNVCRPVFTSLVEKRIQTEDILPEPPTGRPTPIRHVLSSFFIQFKNPTFCLSNREPAKSLLIPMKNNVKNQP